MFDSVYERRATGSEKINTLFLKTISFAWNLSAFYPTQSAQLILLSWAWYLIILFSRQH